MNTKTPTIISDMTQHDIATLNDKLSNNDAVSATQRDLAKKLNELDHRSKQFLGTALMRQGDRRLIHELDASRAESARIILSSRNESLKVVGQTLVRYTKAMANAHISVLEAVNTVNLDGHFLNMKTDLLSKLERAEADFMDHIARKEERINKAPEMLKPAMRQTAAAEIEQYMVDSDRIIKDFSKIRDNRF